MNFDDDKSGELDRSNRWRQRPQQYSVEEFAEAVSDNEADFYSDDDIVGEVIYDEEYLRKRKKRRQSSSSSEGDEEYRWEDQNPEEEEDSLSISEESDEAPKIKKLPGHTRRETKSRSVGELQSGQDVVDYEQYELSESETESKAEKSSPSDEHSDASENEYSEGSQDFSRSDNDQEMNVDPPVEDIFDTEEKWKSQPPELSNGLEQDDENGLSNGLEQDEEETVEKEQSQSPDLSNGLEQDGEDGVRKRRYLDLNELAPGSGFDDGLNTIMEDDRNDFWSKGHNFLLGKQSVYDSKI